MLEIRRMLPSDHNAINDIAVKLHPEWFTRDALEEISQDIQRQDCMVAVHDGRVIGFAVYVANCRSRTSELSWIGVHPEFHRRGVGRALLHAIEKELRTGGYEALEVHTVASSVDYEPYASTRSFYHALGFVEVGVEPKGYPSGDDKLLLKKSLAS